MLGGKSEHFLRWKQRYIPYHISVTNIIAPEWQVSTEDEAMAGTSLSDLWMDFLMAETTEDENQPKVNTYHEAR